MDFEDLYEEDAVGSDESDDEQLQFSGDEGEGKCGRGGAKESGLADCQTLTPDKLSKKMFELINEVNAVFEASLEHSEIVERIEPCFTRK